MKAKHSLVLGGILCLAIFGTPSVPVSAQQEGGAATYVANFTGSAAKADKAVTAAGGRVVAIHSSIGVLVAESASAGFASALEADASVSDVVQDQIIQWLPDVQVSTEDMPNLSGLEPSFFEAPPQTAAFLANQWNIFKTQTDQAWLVTEGSPAVKVAILDTGICAHHLDTLGKVDAAQSASFVPVANECSDAQPPACIGCPPWEDRNFHGTHVGATVSSNNHGTAGIAPDVRLRAVKVLNCNGSGAFSWVIAGIIFAADTGNHVINMSLGAEFPKNAPGGAQLVAALNKAVNYAKSKGVLVVSAAGNSGRDMQHDGNTTAVPCESGSGMCVGSTTNLDLRSTFSNHGVSGPQLMAPGGGSPTAPPPPFPFHAFILAPCSFHSVLIPVCGTSPTFYVFAAGTSMATPHVSGAAALVDSLAKQGPGTANPAQLKTTIIQTADDLGNPGTDNEFSHGRLNVLKAVLR